MQFYVLEVKVGSPYETWYLSMEPVHIGEVTDCQKCPACSEPMGSLPWLPPYRATIRAHGRELGDVAFSGDILVSEKFRQAWMSAQLKGIDTFHPLERVRVRPARLGRKTVTYYYVVPRLFGTRVDFERSLINYDKPFTCMTCQNGVGSDTVRGFKIDEPSWTGEDIFIAWRMPGSIIVSDRVRQLRDDYGLTNVTLTPTEEYLWDPLNKWTPVDYSLPDGIDGPDFRNMDEVYEVWGRRATFLQDSNEKPSR